MADVIHYQSMVGSLLHAARVTCPDIAHAVGKFNAALTQAPKRIFWYLKGTIDLTLQYR